METYRVEYIATGGPARRRLILQGGGLFFDRNDKVAKSPRCQFKELKLRPVAVEQIERDPRFSVRLIKEVASKPASIIDKLARGTEADRDKIHADKKKKDGKK